MSVENPQTKDEWLEWINAQIEERKKKAQTEIQAAQDKSMEFLTSQANFVAAQERYLTDNLIGFRTGLIPAAIRTDRSEALLRDPLYGYAGSAPPAAKKSSIGFLALLAGAGLYYFYSKKGKRP